MIVRAYGDFEERVGLITPARGAKSEMVRAAIRGFNGSFAARELQERCPNVGLDLVRRILREERRAGRVEFRAADRRRDGGVGFS